MSDYDDALNARGLDLETLRYILRLAYEHLAQTGRELTATELRALLRLPTP